MAGALNRGARPLRIGLTGGIGSGKSTVARLLVDRGAVLVDTDAIARQLTQPGGAAIDAVRAAFGSAAISPDGAMDRSRMRDRVFGDPAARQRLEAILHPLIGLEVDRQAAAAATASVIVFDVPLLVEGIQRWRSRVDRILVVDCAPATQIDRVVARSGWTSAAAAAVVAQQATREARRAVADDLLDNDGSTLAELGRQVEALWRGWTAPA